MVFQMERINYSGGHIEMGSFHSNLLIFQPIIHTSRLQAGLGDISGKSKPLPKVLCFSWMVTREACLTQENLKRKGFQFCSRCSLCDSNTELVLHCSFTDQLWEPSYILLDSNGVCQPTPVTYLRVGRVSEA